MIVTKTPRSRRYAINWPCCSDRPTNQNSPGQTALLATLPHRLPRVHLHQPPLTVSPDTVLRCHRELLPRRHAKASRPKRPGQPRTARSVRALVLRPAREKSSRGYRRIHGELTARSTAGCRRHRVEHPQGPQHRPRTRTPTHHPGNLPTLPGHPLRWLGRRSVAPAGRLQSAPECGGATRSGPTPIGRSPAGIGRWGQFRPPSIFTKWVRGESPRWGRLATP
jgi:hypothetical protein